MIDRFRREIYQSFEQRADAGMDLIDALTSALVVESPVTQSESLLFRRKFSSVYDFLKHGRLLTMSNSSILPTDLPLRHPEPFPPHLRHQLWNQHPGWFHASQRNCPHDQIQLSTAPAPGFARRPCLLRLLWSGRRGRRPIALQRPHRKEDRDRGLFARHRHRYVGPTEERGAEMRIDGQTAFKKVADSVTWSGSPLPGVQLDINQRVLFYNDDQMRLGGQVTILVDEVNPQPLLGPARSDIIFAIPVTYNIKVGETVPGTTLRLERIDAERGAEFSGWSVEQIPFKKSGDSIIWDGSLRQGVAVTFKEMRVAFIGDTNVRLAGIVEVALLP